MDKIVFVVESLGLGGSKQATANLAEFIHDNTSYETGLFAMRSGKVVADYQVAFDDVMIGDQVSEKLPQNYNPQTDVSDETKKKWAAYISSQQQIKTIVAVGGYASIFVAQNRQATVGKRVITWLHNNPELYLSKAYAHVYAALRQALMMSDQLVVLTPEYAEKFAIYQPNTIAIPNIINMKHGEAVFDLIQAKKQRYLQSSSERVITFIGRGNAVFEKGIDLLAELLILLNDQLKVANQRLTLNLLGAQLQDLSPYLGHHVLTHIKLGQTGDVSQDDVFHYLKTSTLLLATSRQEGLPNSMIEALQLATLVIAYANSGARAILGNSALLIPLGLI
jgi:glycosyltransferase involved in cell wall biosynthesis